MVIKILDNVHEHIPLLRMSTLAQIEAEHESTGIKINVECILARAIDENNEQLHEIKKILLKNMEILEEMSREKKRKREEMLDRAAMSKGINAILYGNK